VDGGCAWKSKGCLSVVRRPLDSPVHPLFTALFENHFVWHDMLSLHELPRRAVASLRSAHRVLGDLAPLRISKRHSRVFAEKRFLWCAAENVWVARGGDYVVPLFDAALRYSTGRNALLSLSNSNMRLYATTDFIPTTQVREPRSGEQNERQAHFTHTCGCRGPRPLPGFGAEPHILFPAPTAPCLAGAEQQRETRPSVRDTRGKPG
jgi:hypothetical protein